MFLYQTNSIVEIIDFPLIEQLNDLNRHYHTWPRGGMVTQRIANPCIPVRFWAWPPLMINISLKYHLLYIYSQ